MKTTITLPALALFRDPEAIGTSKNWIIVALFPGQEMRPLQAFARFVGYLSAWISSGFGVLAVGNKAYSHGGRTAD
jgi:hypothetical protein